MSEQAVKTAKQSGNPLDIFITGARKGFGVAINNLLPNVLMAFVLAHILGLLGVLVFLGTHCAGIMGLFGLSGESITVLLTAWLSASAGTGVAVSLLASGHITPHDVTILLPAIFLMASQIQYMGRLLGVADCPKRYWPMLMVNSILNAVFALIIMNVLLAFWK